MADRIETQVEFLMANLPYLHKTEGGVAGFKKTLRMALLEIARDQRHACAEAITALENANVYNRPETVSKDKAHQAVMNTNLQ